MGWQGILQADAYAGYNQLYDQKRSPGPVTSALCWSHARRKFFELADVESNIRKGKSPKEDLANRFRGGEAHRRPVRDRARHHRQIPPTSGSKRGNACRPRWSPIWNAGFAANARCSQSMPRSPRRSTTCYPPNHWSGFTSFLKDGRICLTNNAAERSLRGVALAENHGSSPGLSGGGQRAAAMYSLIGTAKLNGIESASMACRCHRAHL